MSLRHAALVTLTLLSVAGVASADAPLPSATVLRPAPALLPARPLAAAPAALTFKPIVVSAPLQAVAAQKATFDPAKLQGKLTYLGNIPQLRLSPTKLVQLAPVMETPPVFAAIDPAHRAQIAKFAVHYQNRYVGRARPPIKFRLDNIVDPSSWQSPIRDQGGRGTCVAFASMAGLEWAFKKSYAATKDLSENHAYNIFMSKVGSTCMADPGICTVDAADYLKTERVCEESDSAYVTSVSAGAGANVG